MTKIIKNILGISLIIASLALGYALVSYVNSYNKAIEPSSFRNFSVQGEAKITALPDIASFNFQVITEGGDDMSALQIKNTKANNKIISFLKNQDIKSEDIKTQSYTVTPRYQTSKCYIRHIPENSSYQITNNPEINSQQVCPPRSIVGYTISQSINVKIHDFNKIGNIMKGVVRNGANHVSSLSFTIDDPSALQNEAKIKAIKKAEEKAKLIAKAGGFKIGRLLGIQEGIQSYRNFSMTEKSLSIKGATPDSPIIEPGSQNISATVTLRYEIK